MLELRVSKRASISLALQPKTIRLRSSSLGKGLPKTQLERAMKAKGEEQKPQGFWQVANSFLGGLLALLVFFSLSTGESQEIYKDLRNL